MPLRCVGCLRQKRKKTDKFYKVNQSLSPQKSLEFLNFRRCAFKRPRLDNSELTSESRICQPCYDSQSNFKFTPEDENAYKKGICHPNSCTFNCDTPNNLTRVPQLFRQKLILEHFYIPANSRMCNAHFSATNWSTLLNQVRRFTDSEDLKEILVLQQAALTDSQSQRNPFLNLHNIDNIPDNSFRTWFGFTKTQFQDIVLVAQCDPICLSAFLSKVCTASSDERLASLFGISRRALERRLARATFELSTNLVPVFLNHFDREQLLKHNTPIAQSIFTGPSNICLIFDGTYRDIEKSMNFPAQRAFYSGQKKKPLYKKMVGCTTDGLVVYVKGAFPANANDASILSYCINCQPEGLEALRPGDVILLDRGFRDCVQELQAKGFKVNTPSFKQEGGQLSTLSANESRLVTKLRWIIEQVFGRLKQKFKYFSAVGHNLTIEADNLYFDICLALMNLFHTPIESDKNYPHLANYMLTRKHLPNKLMSIVDQYNLRKLTRCFSPATCSSLASKFPQFSLQDFHVIACGGYQMKLAKSYNAEHRGTHADFLLEILQHEKIKINFLEHNIDSTEPLLIRAKIHSRFFSSKIRMAFILTDSSKAGLSALLGYCCNCDSGSRTVGTCAHVMAVLWQLSYGNSNATTGPNPYIARILI